MITSPIVAKMAEVTAPYRWQIECRDDERRDGELYWITPTNGTTYTDRFETGEWRAIP